MSLIKNKWLSSLLVIFISILVSLLIANGLAAWWVHNHRKDLAETSSEATAAYLAGPAVEFRNKYNWQLHHLRGFKAYGNGSLEPTELLFSTISPFSQQGTNLLIQGDSWAEQANTPTARVLLQDFARSEHIGLVSAGVGSYAPTPMSAQLNILRKDFGLHPTVLVALIDQTDIADEFIRYANPVLNSDGHAISVLSTDNAAQAQDQSLAAQRDQLMRSSKPALIKLFGYKLYRKQEAEIATQDPTKDSVLEPLINGPTPEQKQVFMKRFDAYINNFFVDSAAKTLIVVTHPHRRHLLPSDDPLKYKGNVADLVNATIKASPWAARIKHIDVMADFQKVYGAPDLDRGFYREGDEFSHLSDTTYNSTYLPYLLAQIASLLPAVRQ